MAMQRKKLVLTLQLEDEDNWRNTLTVRRVLLSREFESLRMGPRPYVQEEAARMWDQLVAGEAVHND